LLNAPDDFSIDNIFTSEILPDKASLLASNSTYKLYVVFNEINFALESSSWGTLAQDVYNESVIAKQANTILMVVPYFKTQCNGTNWLGLTVSRGTGLIMPGVYCANSSLKGLMNSALSLAGTSWESGFNQAFSHIPKNYITYDYKFLWNGDLVYDGIEKYDKVTGNDDIIEIRLLVDERFHKLKKAYSDFSFCNLGTTGGVPGASYTNISAQSNCWQQYDNTVNAILSTRADFKVVKKTNLVQSKLDEKVAQEFAQWYAKRKNWGFTAYFSSPEDQIFYGGRNPESVQDALVLIDIASGVASFVGADAIFDGLGAYYAYNNGEYTQAAFYTTAAAVPFLSSAVRRAVIDGGDYVLKTMKGSYVTRPKNVLGMNYFFEVKDAFSHFTKTALNSNSFNRAVKFKTETKFLEALEDGMLADNTAIKALNDKPELVDEFNAFYNDGKGGLAEFLASDKILSSLTGTLKATYNELLSGGLKSTVSSDNVIRLLTKEGEEVAVIANNKLTPSKWGAYKNTLTKIETSEGYWLVKDGNEVIGIDLGFKENRTLEASEVNAYWKNGRAGYEPYKLGTKVTERSLQKGEKVFVVEYATQGQPGLFASKERIKSVQELREKLAVLKGWKDEDIGFLIVREYEVKKPIRVRDGSIGPQIEETGISQGKTLSGGGHQYEFLEGKWDLLNNRSEQFLQFVVNHEIKL
jgi:hypothetical protein